jgi:hypothetical protein
MAAGDGCWRAGGGMKVRTICDCDRNKFPLETVATCPKGRFPRDVKVWPALPRRIPDATEISGGALKAPFLDERAWRETF